MGTKELEKEVLRRRTGRRLKQNPLVSTGLVLIPMIVVQTAIMIWLTFGEWAAWASCRPPC
ncbi:MAG: hypothetical protein ACLRX2_12625 [Oscillospiraceae bacterium]